MTGCLASQSESGVFAVYPIDEPHKRELQEGIASGRPGIAPLLVIQRRWWLFSWQAESDEPIGRLVPLKEETFVHGTAARVTKPLWGCEVFCSDQKEETR